MNSHVWVEVSVNIGTRCLKIEIERKDVIEEVVRQFISDNKLSSKYQPLIVNLIKEQIRNRVSRDQITEKEISVSESMTCIKQPSRQLLGHCQSSRQQMNQSIVNNKENGLLAEMLKIQEETNKKRNVKLAELRHNSQSKLVPGTAERSVFDMSIQRPSFSNTQAMSRQRNLLQSTPRMATDQSQKSSVQALNCTGESNKQLQSGNSFEKQQDKCDEDSRGINDNVAQLKQLLLSNAYNSRKKSAQESSIWVENNSKPKRLNTQRPQQVYDRWKRAEQHRRVESESHTAKIKNVKVKSKSPAVKHEDNFFYNKGKSFLEQKKKKVETKFKEIYPFKISKTPTNFRKGMETTQRLFNQSKEHFNKKLVKPRHIDLDLNLKPDHIREKVRKRDQQHDQVLSELIRQGQIRPTVALKYNPKSPFRKTIIFN